MLENKTQCSDAPSLPASGIFRNFTDVSLTILTVSPLFHNTLGSAKKLILQWACLLLYAYRLQETLGGYCRSSFLQSGLTDHARLEYIFGYLLEFQLSLVHKARAHQEALGKMKHVSQILYNGRKGNANLPLVSKFWPPDQQTVRQKEFYLPIVISSHRLSILSQVVKHALNL